MGLIRTPMTLTNPREPDLAPNPNVAALVAMGVRYR